MSLPEPHDARRTGFGDPIGVDNTPNVVVQNPSVRLVANIVLGVALIFFPAAIVLDGATDALDFSAWTTPAMAVTSFLAGIFGVAVTAPNVPRKH